MALPSEKVSKRWRKQFSWLDITNNKTLICKICCSQEDKLRSMPNGSTSFISGSCNYQLSALKDHDNSACHQHANREKEHEEAVAVGKSLPPRKIQHRPLTSESPIFLGIQQTTEKDRETLSKLHNISFHIALQRLPFTAFQNQVVLEKLHGVKFTSAYENENACKNFIFGILKYLFEEKVKKKLHLVNFITILCDRSTDNSVIEQEVLYVIFTDPEPFKPTMKFFKVVAPADSQDAPGLKNAIFATFHKHYLESVLSKIVFLSSDGAFVNSDKDSGLIRLLKEDFPWISFVWCFSHRLELALKDALKEFIEPADISLMHLFYLYKKSSKKHRELKNLYHLLEGQFEMYSAGVRSLKATGTGWIDHKIAVMGRVIEKFSLYTQHLQHSINTAKKSQDRTTLQGTFTKLINTKFLLRCALFTDVLGEAKHFSLITQEQNIDIIRLLDSAENTKHNYECLLKKLQKNLAYVFQLPTCN